MKNLVIIALVGCIASCNAFSANPRIVDGRQAALGQFPFYAFLQSHLGGDKGAACGASLLNSEWLVTAAHCLQGAKAVDVILGENDLQAVTEETVGVQVSRKGLFPHPEYDPERTLNDIALIRLPVEIEFSDYIQSVKMPKNCKRTTVDNAIAIGHGLTRNAGDVSMPLHYAFLTTIPSKLCGKVYPIIGNRKSIVCAMSSDMGFQSVCSGDSGGPLVRASDLTLIGISDFVQREGCEAGLPQGFSNVYSHLKWIQEVTGIELPEC